MLPKSIQALVFLVSSEGVALRPALSLAPWLLLALTPQSLRFTWSPNLRLVLRALCSDCLAGCSGDVLHLCKLLDLSDFLLHLNPSYPFLLSLLSGPPAVVWFGCYLPTPGFSLVMTLSCTLSSPKELEVFEFPFWIKPKNGTVPKMSLLGCSLPCLLPPFPY